MKMSRPDKQVELFRQILNKFASILTKAGHVPEDMSGQEFYEICMKALDDKNNNVINLKDYRNEVD